MPSCALVLKNWLFMLCLLPVLALAAGSQPPIQSNSLHFGQYKDTQGLSHNQIGDILQDSDGFVWIATYEGLNRFDGFNFKVYRADNAEQKNALGSNYVTALVEDNQRNLWIGTAEGVSRLNLDSYQMDYFPLGGQATASQVFVNQLLVVNNRLWVGASDGLYTLDKHGDQFEEIELPEAIKDQPIVSLAADDQGKIWFAVQPGGIYMLNTSTRKAQPVAELMPELQFIPEVRTVWFDKQQRLWLGSAYTQIQIIDRATRTARLLALPKPHEKERALAPVRSFAHDSQGKIWITTMGRGLYVYDPLSSSVQHYHRSSNLDFTLRDNYLWKAVRDNQGRMWLATDVAGVLYHDPKSRWFTHYFHDPANEQSIGNGSIWSIYLTRSGNLWVGHDEGVDLLDANRRKIKSLLNRPDEAGGLSDNRVFNIIEDQSGDIWFTSDLGIDRYNVEQDRFTYYRHQDGNPNALPGPETRVFYMDDRKRLWIGTSDGLARYRPQSDDFKTFEKTLGNEIYDIIEGAKNHYWLASHQQGLLYLDANTGHVIHYRHSPDDVETLSSNKATSLVLKNQYLWIATLNGLNRLHVQTGQIRRFHIKDGLPSNVVYRILQDEQGRIWGSTSKGLFAISTDTLAIDTYGVKYGLQGPDFTTFGAHKGHNGELFFGGANGVSSFVPSQVPALAQAKPPVLTELSVLNLPVNPSLNGLLTKPLHQTHEIELTHRQNLFTVAFSSLQMAAPESLQYSYQLEGFNDEWLTPLPGKPQATFTNLDSGSYRLLTRAREANGQWSTPNASLTIHIKPPPWSTWWALLLYALVLSLVLASLFWQRLQKKRQQQVYLRNLEQRKKQLDLALWASGDELWEWDMTHRTMTRFNCLENSIDRFFGEEFTLDKLAVFIHPDDVERVLAAINDHIDGKVPHYEESFRMLDREDKWMWVLDRGQVVEKSDNGEPLKFSGTTKNIDRLKQAEGQLRELTGDLEQRVAQRTADLEERSTQLENANRHLQEALRVINLTRKQLDDAEKMAVLGNLVVGVSHEINTPLGIAITAWSTLEDAARQLFEEKQQGKLTNTRFDDFEQVFGQSHELLQGNLQRTRKLIENFKQVAVNQSDEARRQFDIEQLLTDCVANATARYDNSRLLLNLDCNAQGEMDSFPMSLAGVFAQLIENAVEHRKDANLPVTVLIQAQTRGNELMLDFQDNGSGIDSQVQNRMFEPFYTTQRGQGRTGLGLHIVYNQITQRLGGSIDYRAEPSKGARFEIHLPTTAPDNPTVPQD